jgi:hypothetical protein
MKHCSLSQKRRLFFLGKAFNNLMLGLVNYLCRLQAQGRLFKHFNAVLVFESSVFVISCSG